MEINESLEILKSLADESRLRVINLLLEKPHCVEELARRLNLAASTVSFHLKKLEAVGLVTRQKEQYYIIYNIRGDVFALSLRQLSSFANPDRYLQQQRVEKHRQKVLKAFVKHNRLEKLPVQWKKRMIVLEEFRKMFNAGRKYQEKEVTDVITGLYDDYCTVRRLMIEEGMMNREGDMYWLNDKYKSEFDDVE